jgi:Putative prokaryotic signal transducing protein
MQSIAHSHPEAVMDPIDPVEVYTSFNPAEAEIIKGMLEAEGIQAEVAGEAQGGFSGTLPEVSVLVHADNADRARELIRAHQESAAKEPSDTSS